MRENLLAIALNHSNLIARQRAKRALRLRYKITFHKKPALDPTWLTAHD